VRDMIAVDDVIVPVSLTLFQRSALELEASDPSTALLGVLGERELTLVVVPRAEQVHGLAVGGSAESEVKLNSGHCDGLFDSETSVKLKCLLVLSFCPGQTNG